MSNVERWIPAAGNLSRRHITAAASSISGIGYVSSKVFAVEALLCTSFENLALSIGG